MVSTIKYYGWPGVSGGNSQDDGLSGIKELPWWNHVKSAIDSELTAFHSTQKWMRCFFVTCFLQDCMKGTKCMTLTGSMVSGSLKLSWWRECLCDEKLEKSANLSSSPNNVYKYQLFNRFFK